MPRSCWPTGNYLRVRGEYVTTLEERLDRVELPPRARRILLGARVFPARGGTTSACAENTSRLRECSRTCGNYLRVRGEYHGVRLQPLRMAELPPRARRIQLLFDITP